MDPAKISLYCFFYSYLAALLVEIGLFVRRLKVGRWVAVLLSLAGLFAHSVYLVVRSQQHDLPPLLGSSHDWLLVLAWLAIAFYLGVQVWNLDISIGVFVLPLVLILVGTARFVNMTPNPRLVDIYWWGMLHASLWVLGIGGVAVALVVSLMYLVQHRRLKSKSVRRVELQLLSLERLNQWNWWLVIVSVPLLTLGMGTGLWMTLLARETEHPVHLANMAFVANAVIWAAMAVLFGWLLMAKHPTGRIVAWRTMLACGFLLTTLLLLKVLSADGIHGVRPA